MTTFALRTLFKSSVLYQSLKAVILLPITTIFSVSAMAGMVSVSNYPLALLSHEVTQGQHLKTF